MDITNWLLGLVAAGFLGWSFAVFRAINAVAILAARVQSLENERHNHEGMPWHSEAGTRIRLIEERVERLEHAARLD